MAKLDLEIDGATQYATLYANGEPVATFQRRRVMESRSLPAWRVFDTSGAEIGRFFLPLPASAMAKRVAQWLKIA